MWGVTLARLQTDVARNEKYITVQQFVIEGNMKNSCNNIDSTVKEPYIFARMKDKCRRSAPTGQAAGVRCWIVGLVASRQCLVCEGVTSWRHHVGGAVL